MDSRARRAEATRPGKQLMGYAIEITTAARRRLAVVHFHVATSEVGAIGERMAAAFGTVVAYLGRVGVTPEGPAVAHYQRAGDGFDVSAGFPITEPLVPGDGVGVLEIRSAEVAHTTHVGPYDQLPGAYDALRAGVEVRGRSLDDDSPMWEEYWSGPETPPEKTRTEVYWPVRGV